MSLNVCVSVVMEEVGRLMGVTLNGGSISIREGKPKKQWGPKLVDMSCVRCGLAGIGMTRIRRWAAGMGR